MIDRNRRIERSDRRNRRHLPSLAASVLAAAVALAAAALLAQAPQYQGYERSSDHVIEVDGKPDTQAEVYFSRQTPSYLVLSSQLRSPVLIVPRSQVVRGVHIMKVSKQPDGTIALLSGALLEELARIEMQGSDVRFRAYDHDVVFKEKPPLLGLQSLEAMTGYSEEYLRLARVYEPASDALAALRAVRGEARVRVYFGSWCPFCQQYVPRMMRVAQELQGSALRIDFYGLPRAIGTDPVAQRAKVDGVPTGIVWVGGTEVGRIRTEEWRAPEKALQTILAR